MELQVQIARTKLTLNNLVARNRAQLSAEQQLHFNHVLDNINQIDLLKHALRNLRRIIKGLK